MNNWLGIAAVLALLPLLCGAVAFAGPRLRWSAELRRKAVHVGMGLATVSFPWIFDHWWPVAVVCALSVLMLQAIKRWEASRGEAVVFGVERSSLGELCFPLAVVIVFWWAAGDWVLHVVPILMLTFADAAGALIGASYGRMEYTALSGRKSLEGSVVFFCAAFFSAHVPLLLGTGTERAETLLIAAILGLVVMMFEAIATRGLDNLVVPLASAYLLREYLALDVETLLWRLVLVAVLLVAVLLTRRRSTLEGGALLGAVLLAYACAALGDWRFLVPVLILFAVHLAVTSRIDAERRRQHDLSAVLGFTIAVMPWLGGAKAWPERADLMLGCFTISVAAYLTILNFATRINLARPKQAFVRSVGRGWCAVGLVGWALTGFGWWIAAGLGLTAAVLPLALWVFRTAMRNPADYPSAAGRWTVQALIALVSGTGGLLLLAVR